MGRCPLCISGEGLHHSRGAPGLGMASVQPWSGPCLHMQSCPRLVAVSGRVAGRWLGSGRTLQSCPDTEKSQRKKEACEAGACRVLSWLRRSKGTWGVAPQGLRSFHSLPASPPCSHSMGPSVGQGAGVVPSGTHASSYPACRDTLTRTVPSASLHRVSHTRTHTPSRLHVCTLSTVRLPTSASARQPKAVGWPSSAAHLHTPAPRCSIKRQQNPPQGKSTPSPQSGMGTAVVMPMGTSTAPELGLGEHPVLPHPPRQVSLRLQSSSSGNRNVKRGHRKG